MAVQAVVQAATQAMAELAQEDQFLLDQTALVVVVVVELLITLAVAVAELEY
jgi:hypothetical protein